MNCKVCNIYEIVECDMCLECLYNTLDNDDADSNIDIEAKDSTLCECGHHKEHIGKETVCTNCGLYYGYDYINEFIDFYENMYKIRRKSVYHRKYHIDNTLFKFRLTRTERDNFDKFMKKVEQSYNQINNCKKGMIKLDYIYYKIFQLMELPNKQQICKIVKSKSVLNRYKVIWKQICDINNWEYDES